MCMSYKNLDCGADEPIQYKELHFEIASIHEEGGVSLFGPVNAYLLLEDFDPLSYYSSIFVNNGIAEEAMNQIGKRVDVSPYKHETDFSPLTEPAC